MGYHLLVHIVEKMREEPEPEEKSSKRQKI